MDVARSTRTIAHQQFTIPLAGGALADEVDVIVAGIRAEAANVPEAGAVWLRTAGDALIVGYTTETTTAA